MFYIALLIYWLCRLYILVLLARVVLDFVQIFKRDWVPRGIVLLIAQFVYTATDPPLRFLARFIPPLRLGDIAFDIGFVVLYFAIQLVKVFAASIMLSSSI